MIVIVDPARAGPEGGDRPARLARKQAAGVGPDRRLHRAGQKVLRRTLRSLRDAAKEADATTSARPLVVHQLRVTTRRLDAALGLFEPCLPKRSLRRLKRLSRSLRRGAGRVRRYDVMLDMLGELGIDSPSAEQVAIRSLMDELRAERVVARRDLARLLSKSKALKRLASGSERLAETRKARGPLLLPGGTVAGEARRMADAAAILLPEWAAMFESTRLAEHPCIEDLHTLRLFGKRVRYTLEILGGSVEPAAFGAAYAQMEQLQERLGVLNDHCELVELLRETARSTGETSGNGDASAPHPLTELADIEANRCIDLQHQFVAWWRGAGGETLVRLLLAAAPSKDFEAVDAGAVEDAPQPEPPVVQTVSRRGVSC